MEWLALHFHVLECKKAEPAARRASIGVHVRCANRASGSSWEAEHLEVVAAPMRTGEQGIVFWPLTITQWWWVAHRPDGGQGRNGRKAVS